MACRPVALVLACAALFAQAQDPVIRINVNLVQIDAVVTDREGKSVPDLRAADFRLLQDGKAQEISNFSRIANGAAAPVSAQVSVGPLGSVRPPQTAPDPAQVRRTMALVVDDLGLSFGSVTRVRNSLRKFVDRQMQPGDLVAIVRTGTGMSALQQFTSDPRLLHAAIDRVQFSMIGRVGTSTFASIHLPEDEDITAPGSGHGYEGRSGGTPGALAYVIEGLRELPGRKSIVLFSENPGAIGRGLIERANRAGVVVYCIDLADQAAAPAASDATAMLASSQIDSIHTDRATELIRASEGMARLAHDTGGLLLYDIDAGLRKVLADSEGYYLIGYHPDAATFNAMSGKPDYHKITLEVNRPGLTVRTRNGFFGQADRDDRASFPQTREGQLRHALSSPFGASDIHVRLTPFFTSLPQLGPMVSGILHIAPEDLTFTDEPGGLHKAVLDVLAVAYDDDGQPADSQNLTYRGAMKEADYRGVMAGGLFYSFRFRSRKPGAYQIRVAVRDAGSSKLGAASQFLAVPDLGKGHLTLSTLAIEGASANRSAMAGGGDTGRVHLADAEGNPAVRIFKSGAAITYGYQVLNAQVSGSKQVDLETQAHLYREDKEVYLGKSVPLTGAGQTDLKRILANGSIKLAEGVASGHYYLQVVVTDRLAKEKYKTASEWIDFEVR